MSKNYSFCSLSVFTTIPETQKPKTERKDDTAFCYTLLVLTSQLSPKIQSQRECARMPSTFDTKSATVWKRNGTAGHNSAARMRRLKSKYFLALSCFSIPKSKQVRIRAAETSPAKRANADSAAATRCLKVLFTFPSHHCSCTVRQKSTFLLPRLNTMEPKRAKKQKSRTQSVKGGGQRATKPLLHECQLQGHSAASQ